MKKQTTFFDLGTLVLLTTFIVVCILAHTIVETYNQASLLFADNQDRVASVVSSESN